MKILVLNAGSSSLRYELFKVSLKKAGETSGQKNVGPKNSSSHSPVNGRHSLTSLYEGMIDRIGFSDSVKNYDEALKKALNELISKNFIKNLDEIKAVGHRVVHGGEKYRNPVKITPAVIKEIQKLSRLAPLHNPPNLKGIRAVLKQLKAIPQVAVFDTAFHQTLEPKAYLYALPQKFYKNFGIRRYGFHGTSHFYVSKSAQKMLDKSRIAKRQNTNNLGNGKIITCHLGNGISVTAIKDGRSVDTSMGFTPLEGLPMGTRCGDIDPAIVYKLMEKLKIGTKEIDKILNKESGLKGIFEESSDMRDIWAKAQKQNKKALFAISYLSYRLAKYIGAYAAAMDGVDAVVFTAGIGQYAWYVRKETCSYLSHLGVALDEKKNRENQIEISTPQSKTKVYVIPTDEEKEIAEQTVNLLNGK